MGKSAFGIDGFRFMELAGWARVVFFLGYGIGVRPGPAK